MGELARQLLLGMSDGGAGSLLFMVETPLIMLGLALIAGTASKQDAQRQRRYEQQLVSVATVDPFAVVTWSAWE